MQGKILKNTSWIILGNGLAAVLVFVTSVVVANKISVSEFGFFQFVYTYFIFIQASENLAHPNVLKSLFHDNVQEKSRVISSSFWLLVTMFGLFFCVALGGWLLTSNRIYLLLSILISGQLFRSLLGISYFFDYSLESSKSQVSQLIGNIFCGAFRSGAVFFSGNLSLQAAGLAGASALASFFWILLSRSWFNVKSLFSFGMDMIFLAKKIFVLSAPLWLLSILHLVLFKVDVLLLWAMASSEDVAIYSNAVRLTEPWSFVVGAIATSFYPIFLAAKKESTLRYYKSVGFYFRMLTAIAVVMAVGLSLFAPLIVNILYGEKYAEVASVLRWHAFNLIPFFLVVGIQVFDVIENFKRFSIIKFVIAGVVAVGLNILLIPTMGVYACVLASFVSYSGLALFFNMGHRRAWRFTVLTLRSFRFFRDDWGMMMRVVSRLRR